MPLWNLWSLDRTHIFTFHKPTCHSGTTLIYANPHVINLRSKTAHKHIVNLMNKTVHRECSKIFHAIKYNIEHSLSILFYFSVPLPPLYATVEVLRHLSIDMELVRVFQPRRIQNHHHKPCKEHWVRGLDIETRSCTLQSWWPQKLYWAIVFDIYYQKWGEKVSTIPCNEKVSYA